MRAALRLAACLRLLGMAAALVAAARPCTAQPRPLSDASAADLLAGKETFDAQCALCHGAGGSGSTFTISFCRRSAAVRIAVSQRRLPASISAGSVVGIAFI